MTATETTAESGPGRWSVLAGAWAVYAAFGLLVASLGALVPRIQDSLDIGDAAMGSILGAWQLVYIVASIPAGRIIDRFGLRRALMASMVVMLASGFGRAAAPNGAALFAAVALHGLGAPIISVGAPKVAASLFVGRQRRLAVGLYSTAPAIGSTLGLVLPANVIGPLLEDTSVGGGWRPTMVVLAGVAALALGAWIVASRGLDAVLVPGSGPELREYLTIARLPVVRFVLILSVMAFFFAHGIGQWLVGILSAAGWDEGAAGLWAAMAAMAGLVAGFTIPGLAAPWFRRSLMIICLSIGAVGCWFLLSPAPAVLSVAILTTTIGRTALMPVLMVTLMDHDDVGPERMAAATGLFFTTAQIGGVAGPSVTGALSDLSGGFRLPLAVHSAVMLATAAVVAVGYRRVASPLASPLASPPADPLPAEPSQR